MRFVTDEKSQNEYKEFLERHERCNFQQSPEWAKVKSNWKNETVLAEDENGKIIGAVNILIRNCPDSSITGCYGSLFRGNGSSAALQPVSRRAI